ncbi:MAG: hypothetical protein WAO83_23885 [Fuerstiella sp.]
MEAPILRCSLILVSLFISTGAGFQTRNFTVTASTDEIARTVGEAAEAYRRDLAIFWLGQPLPNWSRPCKLRVRDGSMGAGGETKFQFVGKEVLNWDMYVQGSLERILDSVLPHEVNHTIFACHFRRPLPRWADEGAATLFEHRSEQVKQLGLLNQVIKSDREFISLKNLLTMKEYPRGYRPMLILYAEGYALADFLVQQGGQAKYLKFLADGETMGWTEAIKSNYHHGGVDSLQKNWQGWVLAGMPKLTSPNDEMLAAADGETIRGQDVARPQILDDFPVKQTVRSQSPDAGTAAGNTLPPSSRSTSDDVSPQFNGRPAHETPTRNDRLPTSGQGRVQPASGHSWGTSELPSAASRSSRAASFEAPVPRSAVKSTVREVQKQEADATGTPTSVNNSNAGSRFSGLEVSANQSGSAVRTELETTTLSYEFNDRQSISAQRKHLPQERNVVTGSIPQWAGFPGQSELF